MLRTPARIALAVGAGIGAAAVAYWLTQRLAIPKIDPDDPAQVAQGQAIYASHCARCHGANLEGQPNWQERLPNGRLPVPPHDASGHTWHHPDSVIFDLTKYGLGPYAPAGYESDMPAFEGLLTDADIAAVLAYIKSRWPENVRRGQARITEMDSEGGVAP
jgi:mono/diheme cytochrome c family protein